jgi:fructan beta-fructosidase
MNDPNGLVYNQGVYHLFFQHYTVGTNWGPMHWGHATSTDLVHWTEGPIALYPDSLGYIFSGSAVVDKENTSGFGGPGQTPLVAIFTHHDTARQNAGRHDFENQSIAYSLDNGATWTKYKGNPVVLNPGSNDFRDPKVRWFWQTRRWVMVVSVENKVHFYSSPDLKSWTFESEFGRHVGAHGGVWECPDLFPIGEKWVLTANIGSGGPNGGSGVQYFTGSFDGHEFVADDTATKWVDYGLDNYAGVTWSNTGDRTIWLGWMSNTYYAGSIPTSTWRSANTIPRELGLRRIKGSWRLTSVPVKELAQLQGDKKTVRDVKGQVDINSSARIVYRNERPENFELILSNEKGEKTLIGFDAVSNRYYVDRKASGKIDFSDRFAGRHFAPRFVTDPIVLTIYVDNSSIEVFGDNGLSVLSEQVFPSTPYSRVEIHGSSGKNSLRIDELYSIWK